MVVLVKKAGWLSGWKAIAQYCDCSKKSVERMAKKGLPVRKSIIGGVVALPAELDQWLKDCELLQDE